MMFVALSGKRGARHFVSGALFIPAEPAVTDGLSDRGETRNLSHFQCPGQRRDRSHSRNGPEPFDSLCQQRISLEGADQGVFPFSAIAQCCLGSLAAEAGCSPSPL